MSADWSIMTEKTKIIFRRLADTQSSLAALQADVKQLSGFADAQNEAEKGIAGFTDRLSKFNNEFRTMVADHHEIAKQFEDDQKDKEDDVQSIVKQLRRWTPW
jgi:ribosomal protein S12 methylthiotransferase accessory factor YcaO